MSVFRLICGVKITANASFRRRNERKKKEINKTAEIQMKKIYLTKYQRSNGLCVIALTLHKNEISEKYFRLNCEMIAVFVVISHFSIAYLIS